MQLTEMFKKRDFRRAIGIARTRTHINGLVTTTSDRFPLAMHYKLSDRMSLRQRLTKKADIGACIKQLDVEGL